MSIRRFYHVFSLLLLSATAQAQPVFTEGTHLGQLGGIFVLNAAKGHMTNAYAQLSAGRSLFLNDELALGGELHLDFTPLTQGYASTLRVQKVLPSKASWTLIGDVHVGGGVSFNRTITGGHYYKNYVLTGVGLQSTWWVSDRAGVFFWPQVSLTNGGASGLWGPQLYIPLGVQWIF
jgi:hypothetical protein